MGKYLIVNLFNDPIKEYHRDIVLDLNEKFSVQPQKISAHMTLLPPFESEDIKALLKYTEHYAKAHKRMPITVGGVGSFRDNVLYLNISMTHDAETTLMAYIEKSQSLFSSKEQLVAPHVFHCTLVSRRISKKFDEISVYLENKNKKFDSFIDNLTLMKWNDDEHGWFVERQFHFHP